MIDAMREPIQMARRQDGSAAASDEAPLQVAKNFAHALLHVQKACGKLAAVVNDAEHAGSEFKADEVDCYVADLVVCALRMANTCPVGRLTCKRPSSTASKARTVSRYDE